MAMDATMLDSGCGAGQAMWRFYGWAGPAMTFGYSQRRETVQSMLPAFDGALVRRLTGGGIVDHRNDLTYALTLPPGHPFYRKQALDIYRELHEGIAGIFARNGIPARLAPCERACGDAASTPGTGFCFPAAEPYDVIQPVSGRKMAGAAMKRNKSGILVQGSIDRTALGGLPVDPFMEGFGRFLAIWLDLKPVRLSDPLPSATLASELQRFRSREWNERR